jgi:hypothetical protein
MPGDRTLRSLDASHVIPTRVLRFEVSRLCCHTLVRPVWSSCLRYSALALWINQETLWFSGEPLEPRELDVASANHHS